MTKTNTNTRGLPGRQAGGEYFSFYAEDNDGVAGGLMLMLVLMWIISFCICEFAPKFSGWQVGLEWWKSCRLLSLAGRVRPSSSFLGLHCSLCHGHISGKHWEEIKNLLNLWKCRRLCLDTRSSVGIFNPRKVPLVSSLFPDEDCI